MTHATARVRQLIELYEVGGTGKDGDPFRAVYRYFTFEGREVAVRDEWLEGERAKKQEEPQS